MYLDHRVIIYGNLPQESVASWLCPSGKRNFCLQCREDPTVSDMVKVLHTGSWNVDVIPGTQSGTLECEPHLREGEDACFNFVFMCWQGANIYPLFNGLIEVLNSAEGASSHGSNIMKLRSSTLIWKWQCTPGYHSPQHTWVSPVPLISPTDSTWTLEVRNHTHSVMPAGPTSDAGCSSQSRKTQ